MKVLKVVQYVLMLIGTIMLLGALYWYQNTHQFTKKALKAEGVVIDLIESRSSNNSSSSYTYAPKVKFNTDKGQEITFTTSSSSNPPSYEVDEKVEVFYLREHPNDAKINSYFDLWGGATIVGMIGSIFLIIGSSILLFSHLSSRKKINLSATGQAIQADYQNVELNESISVNNTHPYRILAQWINPDTSELHLFKSENIWFDPTNHIKNKKMKVYIAPNNPQKYHMDISFLPKLAE